MPQGIAVAGAAIRRWSGFAGFLRSYIWILVWILAAVGLCLIVGLQFKWIDLVRPDNEHPAADASVMEIKGPTNLFSEKTFVIDTGQTYQLGAQVRVMPKSDGSPQASIIYFGVQTFDVNGRELRSGPGTYRYAGASGKVVGSSQGWVHIGGLITGEGDSSHTEFRPGTHSVKLVLLVNYRSGDDKTFRIRDVSFSQQITFVPQKQ